MAPALATLLAERAAAVSPWAQQLSRQPTEQNPSSTQLRFSGHVNTRQRLSRSFALAGAANQQVFAMTGHLEQSEPSHNQGRTE